MSHLIRPQCTEARVAGAHGVCQHGRETGAATPQHVTWDAHEMSEGLREQLASGP